MKLDLKIKHDYDKIEIAKNIAKACNQAEIDGLTIDKYQWSVRYSKETKLWKPYSQKYVSPLGSVLRYSETSYWDDNIDYVKLRAAADSLGVSFEWVYGFDLAFQFRTNKKLRELKKRNSERGKQCRDGFEVGRLFRYNCLSDEVVFYFFKDTSEQNYKTHEWDVTEFQLYAKDINLNHSDLIYKCKLCGCYGAVYKGEKFRDPFYAVTNNINKRFYSILSKGREHESLSCEELMIQGILV